MNVPLTFTSHLPFELFGQYLEGLTEIYFRTRWEFLIAVSHSDPFLCQAPVWAHHKELRA
jgi:hypothetical protein